MNEWQEAGDEGPCAVDVLVIGGGPAGSTAALMLATQGWRVAIADRAPRRTPRIVETLPPPSRSTLKRLGLWPGVVAAGSVPACGTVCWWDSAAHPTEHDFILNPSGGGWHVDRARFERVIQSAAIDAGAVLLTTERLVGATVDSTAVSRSRWRVRLVANGHSREICARFLVNASGRSSAFRANEVSRLPIDRLVGLAAISEPSPIDLDRRPCIEATPSGWWYSAPGIDGRWSAVFFTDADLVGGSSRQELAVRWSDALAEGPRTAGRLSELGLSSAGAIAGLHLIAANSYTTSQCQGHGWVAAGDAASAVDPLAGQGIERAIRAGIRAAHTVDAVLDAEARANFLASGAAVDRYQREQTAIDRKYLAHRYECYARVNRWSDSPFWQRRNGNNGVREDRPERHTVPGRAEATDDWLDVHVDS